jgi:hypothetical protein
MQNPCSEFLWFWVKTIMMKRFNAMNLFVNIEKYLFTLFEKPDRADPEKRIAERGRACSVT